MTDDRKQDQRSLPRHVLSEPIAVLDRLSQSSLGRLVNIHREGLMVVGSYPFEHERLYQLELQLPAAISGGGTIPVGVDCLWSRCADSQMFWTGFKIIDASEQALLEIDELIACFAMGQ